MTETLCTSGAVKLKSGAGVSSDLTAENYTQLINQAESYINAATRINWVDLYASLDDNLKKILEDAASSHAAIGAVQYDSSNYVGTGEATTIINTNYTRYIDAINLLKEKAVSDFVKER